VIYLRVWSRMTIANIGMRNLRENVGLVNPAARNAYRLAMNGVSCPRVIATTRALSIGAQLSAPLVAAGGCAVCISQEGLKVVPVCR
jgi:hypothetical protein